MQERTLKHFWYYFALICVQVTGLFAMFHFAYDRFLQMITISVMALFYVFWAVIHHQLHHDLQVKIVIEYILIGILGVLIVLFFLLI